jgi:hypothetical protein
LANRRFVTMIRLRFRIRTALFGVVALAVGFGAYRMMHDRFAYCRVRAYYHETGANTVDLQAKCERRSKNVAWVGRKT